MIKKNYMVAWRYQISLLMFNLNALTREIFFNTRREVSYLRETCNILYMPRSFVVVQRSYF